MLLNVLSFIINFILCVSCIMLIDMSNGSDMGFYTGRYSLKSIGRLCGSYILHHVTHEQVHVCLPAIYSALAQYSSPFIQRQKGLD